MVMNTTNRYQILRPEQVADLIVLPVQTASIAAQVSSVVFTTSKTFRVPLVTDDPSAQWVAEGAEITPDDMDLGEAETTPSKVAGLTIITRELADDSSPAAATAVGEGLARDIARKVDTAFFGNLSAPAPPGLGSITPTTVTLTGAWANLDPFSSALAAAENVGAQITGFVANPADVLALSLLKEGTGSNKPLLQPDPTQASRRTILGVPFWVSSAVAANTIWGIPQQRVLVVIRDDATVDVSREAFFTSDRVAVRATMRVGFLFPHPAAVVKITRTP